jgi:hypothetical protein
MFNLKEQEVPAGQNLSADDILANIKKRLGLVDDSASFESQQQGARGEMSHRSSVQKPTTLRTSATQVIGGKPQYEEKNQVQNHKQDAPKGLRSEYQQNSQPANTIDDDFSFDLDFADVTPHSETNANKAYRAYQNAMKSSSYENINQGTNSQVNEDIQETSTNDMEEWNSIEDELVDDNNFNWEEDVSEEGGADFDSTNNYQSQQNSENVYFLNNKATSKQEYNIQENLNSFQEEESAFGNLATNIERTIMQAVNNQVREWCENNLENVCRKIIREELYKEKVHSNQ